MTNRVWDAPNIHVMSGDIWAFDKPQRLYKRVFELSPKRGQTRTLDEKKGVELTKKKNNAKREREVLLKEEARSQPPSYEA